MFSAKLSDRPLDEAEVSRIQHAIREKYGLGDDLLGYLFTERRIDNHVYRPREDNIRIRLRDGSVHNITEVSEQINFTTDKTETKYLITYPKEFRE